MSSKGAPLAFHAPDRDALDSGLVARLNHGDASAFRAIFDAYASPLVLYARSLLNSGIQPAEDIVHDLFTYLWTHRHTIEVQSSLRTYLYRATRNRCCSVLRHERVERAMQESAQASIDGIPAAPTSKRPDNELESAELGVAIERALATLPDRPREIWRLNRNDGLSYSEIAQLFGLSVKTVETHMTRALKTLRIHLANWR